MVADGGRKESSASNGSRWGHRGGWRQMGIAFGAVRGVAIDGDGVQDGAT